jgi:aminoglycoside phosphotransferase (APT) family kinase protein
VSDWSFYIAYCKFRLAAIAQGVYRRGLDGNASSQTALQHHAHAERAAKAGWAVVQAG